MAQIVKNLSAMQEMGVRSLGQEDPRRREWQPTPVFLPGESRGQRSLVGYSALGCKESDTTEQLTHTIHPLIYSSNNLWVNTLFQVPCWLLGVTEISQSHSLK